MYATAVRGWPSVTVRPRLSPNHAHDPSRPEYDRTKQHESADSEAVYERSIPGGDRAWYGLSENGQIYRYGDDGVGGVHFTGSTGLTGGAERVLPMQRVPIDVRRALGSRVR